MRIVDNINEALTLPGNTMQESSVANFTNFLDKKFSGSPVEFCYNTISASADSKGNVKYHPSFSQIHYFCLRSFTPNCKTPTDAALMKVTNKSGRPSIVKQFYDYITGDASPWASCHGDFVAVRPDKNGIPEAYLWFNTGGACSRLVMSMLTAMRLHTCWGLDYVFVKLVDAGFTPEEAILLSTNFSWAGQTLTTSNGPPGMFSEDVHKILSLSKLGVSRTDMPFLTNYSPSGFKPLFGKKPSFSGQSLKAGQSPQPNSFIWNTDGVEVNADNLDKSSKEYKSAKIKIVPSLKAFEWHINDVQSMSAAYVSEVKDKLHNNHILEI
jgi:hypothetical protein